MDISLDLRTLSSFHKYFLWKFQSKLCRFRHAVDLTLHRYRAPKLTNFSVEFKFKPDLKPRINLWVRFATSAKVDQLSPRLSPSNISYLRDTNCPSISTPNGLIGWSSLKHLYFGYASLPDDVINKVLLGSPRLESLKLYDCFGFYRLDIVSESLKKMVIDSYCEELGIDYPLELEIFAPKIESLEIKGCFCNMKKCQIKDLSALVEVRLDFEIPCEYDNEEEEEEEDDRIKDGEIVVREIFESLYQVKKLTVGRWCLTVLSIMTIKQLPSPFLMCKCLTMKTSMDNWDLAGIASLLQNLPHVETLVIDIVSPDYFALDFLDRCYDEVKH